MNYGWGDSQGFISISEDEGNYVSYPCQRSDSRALEYFVRSESKISEEGDQQFWAEDELSSIESNSLVRKRKRRHSVSYRNSKYRSKSRVPQSSTSSDQSSSTRRRRRKKRRKGNTEDIPTNSKSQKSKNCTNQSKILVKSPLKKFRMKFQRK